MPRKIIFAALILMFIISPAFSIEKTDGRIKLEMHKSNGRFSFLYLDDPSKNKYVPFLLDKDPRTTVLNVLIDNKVYTLGASASFKQTMEVSDDVTAFIWESKQLRITQSISFLNTADSLLADGIRVTLFVENISEEEHKVGIRYLFDTWMGEKDNVHFKTDKLDGTTSETDFESDNMPLYWVSPSDGTSTAGLQVMASGPGVTVPDRIVFANWSRLNDSSWTFSSKNTRNFNYLPYSINDSAVCQYYNPESIAPGESRTIVLVMGNYSPGGFVMDASQISSEVSNISEIYQQVVAVDAEGNRVLSLRTELKAVTDLIAKIDQLIAGGKELSEEEYAVINQILKSLKQRKLQY